MVIWPCIEALCQTLACLLYRRGAGCWRRLCYKGGAGSCCLCPRLVVLLVVVMVAAVVVPAVVPAVVVVIVRRQKPSVSGR